MRRVETHYVHESYDERRDQSCYDGRDKGRDQRRDKRRDQRRGDGCDKRVTRDGTANMTRDV